eukprot:750078-Hanusia_phi.AAC.1
MLGQILTSEAGQPPVPTLSLARIEGSYKGWGFVCLFTNNFADISRCPFNTGQCSYRTCQEGSERKRGDEDEDEPVLLFTSSSSSPSLSLNSFLRTKNSYYLQ